MARNVADFMSEIFNGVGGVSGVNAQLNNKLDKTANAVSASKLQTARSMKVSLASNSAANFDGSANVTVGVDGILPASHGGTGVSNLQNLNVGFATTASVAATSNFATRADQDCDGNKISTTYLKAGGTVASANKLATSRSFQTNLASTAAANFDGTANNTHGVTGTLGVANGGTGQTSLANVTVGAANKATLDGSGNNIASTYLKTSGTAAAATKLATSRSFQTNLASTTAAGFDGTANNSHGVTGTLGVANGGTGQTSLANVTVGAANKATLDGSGNNIASTYLSKTDAASTYLGKSAKAASATTADSATNATNDGAGNNIASTYLKNNSTINGALYFGDANSYIKKDDYGFGSEIALQSGFRISAGADDSLLQLQKNYVHLSPNIMTSAGIKLTDTEIFIQTHGNKKFVFKDDGIYLNGTKITN